MFGRTIGAHGRTDCFRHFLKALTKPAVKNSVTFPALEAKHLLERPGRVTGEVLKGGCNAEDQMQPKAVLNGPTLGRVEHSGAPKN